MRTAVNRARETLRDGKFTNAAEPTPMGSVSEAQLTGLTHERLAVAGGQAGLSPEQVKSLQVATPPRLAPGQARSGETSGARNESSRFDHGKGTGSGKGTGNKPPER